MSVFDGPYHWCPDFTTCDKCQILTFHLVGVRNLQLAPYVGFFTVLMLESRFYNLTPECQVLTFHFVDVRNLQLAPHVSF